MFVILILYSSNPIDIAILADYLLAVLLASVDGARLMELSEFVSRRKFIERQVRAQYRAIAGCSVGAVTPVRRKFPAAERTPQRRRQTWTNQMDATEESGSSDTVDSAGGSSTVYPIDNICGSYWNANRPASDSEYWPHGEYDIDTDQNLADYWAGLYGFEAGGEDGPPFQFTVGLPTPAPVSRSHERPERHGQLLRERRGRTPGPGLFDQFIDHVVGVDGQPLVVSQEIADAGVEQITGDQLKSLYKGELTNWSELGGPDREIQVLGRVKGSGTRTSLVSKSLATPRKTRASPTVMARTSASYGHRTGRQRYHYLALASVVRTAWLESGLTSTQRVRQLSGRKRREPPTRLLPPLPGGPTWSRGKSSRTRSRGHRLILADIGQDTFVAPNNYFKLGARRREEERAKLPDQV